MINFRHWIYNDMATTINLFELKNMYVLYQFEIINFLLFQSTYDHPRFFEGFLFNFQFSV